MSKQEILCTPYAEMCDMISCFAVYNGAEIKDTRPMKMEDVFALR